MERLIVWKPKECWSASLTILSPGQKLVRFLISQHSYLLLAYSHICGGSFQSPNASVMTYLFPPDDLTVSCDISNDEELFMGQGDYQFDIYRLMRQENGSEKLNTHMSCNRFYPKIVFG